MLHADKWSVIYVSRCPFKVKWGNRPWKSFLMDDALWTLMEGFVLLFLLSSSVTQKQNKHFHLITVVNKQKLSQILWLGLPRVPAGRLCVYISFQSFYILLPNQFLLNHNAFFNMQILILNGFKREHWPRSYQHFHFHDGLSSQPLPGCC